MCLQQLQVESFSLPLEDGLIKTEIVSQRASKQNKAKKKILMQINYRPFQAVHILQFLCIRMGLGVYRGTSL